jgi:hypothetical protein
MDDRWACRITWAENAFILPKYPSSLPGEYNKEQRYCIKYLLETIKQKNIHEFMWFVSLARDVPLVKQILLLYEPYPAYSILRLIMDWTEALQWYMQFPNLIAPRQFARCLCIALSKSNYTFLNVMRAYRLTEFLPEFHQRIAYHLFCVFGEYNDWYILYTKFRLTSWWSLSECIEAMTKTISLKSYSTSIKTAWDVDKIILNLTAEQIEPILAKRDQFTQKAIILYNKEASDTQELDLYGKERKDIVPCSADYDLYLSLMVH